MLNEQSSLIVAIDHVPLGLSAGLDDIDRRVGAILAGHPDGVVANYGLLKRMQQAFDLQSTTPIARLDGNRTFLAGEWTASADWELFFSAEASARIGAGAVIVNLLLGGPAELASLKVVARAAVACHASGLPLVVSAICVQRPGRKPTGAIIRRLSGVVHKREDPAVLSLRGASFAARMAFEMGADYVVGYDLFAPDALGEIRRWCPVPLLAQGAPSGDREKLHAWAQECLTNGANGVIVGRAIWQSEDPKETVDGLRGVFDHFKAQ